MATSFSNFHNLIIRLSEPIQHTLSQTPYKPPESSNISIKTLLQSYLPNTHKKDSTFESILTNFILLCAALCSSQTSTYDQLTWVPLSLSDVANEAFRELRKGYFEDEGKDLVVEMMVKVLGVVKMRIKESGIGEGEDGGEVSANSARVPVAYAIVAAYQFKWLVTQVDISQLGKLSTLIIPCALTALDHWSPEVKGQGMITFIHLAKHVKAAEFSLYEDVILDACCQNIASDDEIWEYVVEMSVLLVASTQQNNPRSSWYEKLLNEMLSHLWRQPRSKERRISWLKYIEPLFSGMGLVLLGHFRRIFPLFFKWMHADDDESVLLVLDSIKTVIKFTWIRYSPYYDKLVDELVILYKDASLKVERENIRARILPILILLQQCQSKQFEAAWIKHKDDPNLSTLSPLLTL
ncbi:Armadillo-like helical [Artemisia annua]|uniref:Armadillo-like helical n=1 Tax=Artemisia annua TaxID=35608 RepID=A0A2U1KSU7_ARTAN|nr:Armadillo-like helical [Artemisia annua]